MAENFPVEFALNNIVNETEIISNLWSSLPPELMNKILLMLNISIAILIAILIYFIILIIIKLHTLFRNIKEGKTEKHTAKDSRHRTKNPKY